MLIGVSNEVDIQLEACVVELLTNIHHWVGPKSYLRMHNGGYSVLRMLSSAGIHFPSLLRCKIRVTGVSTVSTP